jgi:hypothetical protein
VLRPGVRVHPGGDLEVSVEVLEVHAVLGAEPLADVLGVLAVVLAVDADDEDVRRQRVLVEVVVAAAAVLIGGARGGDRGGVVPRRVDGVAVVSESGDAVTRGARRDGAAELRSHGADRADPGAHEEERGRGGDGTEYERARRRPRLAPRKQGRVFGLRAGRGGVRRRELVPGPSSESPFGARGFSPTPRKPRKRDASIASRARVTLAKRAPGSTRT